MIKFSFTWDSISTKEYSKIIPEMSSGTLKRDLNDLIGKGLVEPIGSRKTRRYKLIKNDIVIRS